MSVDYIKVNEDILEDTKDLVLTQFGNSENIQKLVEIIATEAKSYEEVAEKMFTSFLLESASGYSLDIIGEFVNVPRGNRSDDEYRTALIITAIGANSSITRDSIYRLIEIVTGGIGGYMYSGRYRDLYIYLQESCADRGVAADFLDQYLPVNTQTSIIFESGQGFGFEGNDLAKGLSRVFQRPSEGYAYIELDLDSLSSYEEVILPRATEFLGNDGCRYRSNEEVDLLDTVGAFYWDIPADYSLANVITITARNNQTNEIYKDSYLVNSPGTSQADIASFLTDFFVDNGMTTSDNIYVDTTSSYEFYAGFEGGLTAPLSNPRVVGFDGPYTIKVTGHHTEDQKYFSRIPMSNLTYGEIPVAFGMAFTPVESLDFPYARIEAGDSFYDGCGSVGMVIPEESFSEAGGLATRASLTSLNILGYGVLQDPSDYLYELDSRYAKVLSFAPNDTISVKPIQVINEYDTFAPPLWDSGLSSNLDPQSYGIALRSPSATSVYKPCISEEFLDDQLSTLNSLTLTGRVSDIDLPTKPYYYEVQFPELPSTPSAYMLMFSKVFIDKSSTESSETTSAITATVYCRYNSGSLDYTLGVKFEKTSVKIEGIGTETQAIAENYSLKAEPYKETASDLTPLNGITFGFLIDPSVNLYKLYVNGDAYDTGDGSVLVTSISGKGKPAISPGDIYAPIGVSTSKGIFGIAGYTDNSEAEPSSVNEYGSIKFIYDRNKLNYTSQLPVSAVDIFGRLIYQES